MNPRIRELAIQAGFFYEDYKDIWYLEYHNQTCEEEMKKFAELIVRECCGAADEWYQKHNELHWDPAQHIRNHFGVEE
jgi:hypothetical protein